MLTSYIKEEAISKAKNCDNFTLCRSVSSLWPSV
jgi:hypothetical protein